MRFLVIDDNPEDRELVVRKLRPGFAGAEFVEVICAAEFDEALAHKAFTCVLTDYQLHWSDGLQVLQRVKERARHVPVIMVTESGSEELAVLGLHAGLSDYVLKRHLDRLPSAVQTSLEKAELQSRYDQMVGELCLSEERYRTIAGLSSDYAYVVRVGADGTSPYEWSVGSLAGVFGYTLEELVEIGGLDGLVYPADRALLSQHKARLLSGDSSIMEFRITARDGTVRWLRVFDQPVWDESEARVVRIYGGVQDVTRYRQAEESMRLARDDLEMRVTQRTAELAQANTALQTEIAERRRREEERERLLKLQELLLVQVEQERERAEQLSEENAGLYEQARRDAETKAVLLREVNHRVKNNLAAIIGLLYAQLDRPGVKDESTYQDVIRDLINWTRGLAIVHGMLSAANWAPLPLDELSSRVIHSCLQSSPPGKLVVQVRPSPVHVTPAQAHSLALVVNELASNAARHAVEKRTSGQLTVDSWLENGSVVLRLRDDGPGYPAAVLQEQRRGVGLELVQNLVHQNLRGRLTLGNEDGAVAEVRFPVQEETPGDG